MLPRREINVPGTEQGRIKCQSCHWRAQRQVMCSLFFPTCYFLSPLWVIRDLIGLLVTAKGNKLCPTVTQPHPTFGFWWRVLRAGAMRNKGEVRGRQRCQASSSTVGTSPLRYFSNSDSVSSFFCLLLVGNGNGIIWGLVGPIWEALYLWTSAWDKEGLRKWLTQPTDSLIQKKKKKNP